MSIKQSWLFLTRLFDNSAMCCLVAHFKRQLAASLTSISYPWLYIGLSQARVTIDQPCYLRWLSGRIRWPVLWSDWPSFKVLQTTFDWSGQRLQMRRQPYYKTKIQCLLKADLSRRAQCRLEKCLSWSLAWILRRIAEEGWRTAAGKPTLKWNNLSRSISLLEILRRTKLWRWAAHHLAQWTALLLAMQLPPLIFNRSFIL